MVVLFYFKRSSDVRPALSNNQADPIFLYPCVPVQFPLHIPGAECMKQRQQQQKSLKRPAM